MIHSSFLNPILSTKLYVPRSSDKLLPRNHLSSKLNKVLTSTITTVTAPPGFGKSTLVSSWIRNETIPAGWVSLDKGENDLSRFWAYVISALQVIKHDVGSQALSLLQSPINASIENVITLLVNDLVTITDDYILVLDDYHLIESRDVHQSLTHFLERIPLQMHLCILSRTEIPLPMGKLRAKGQLTELGISDIRFTREEILSYWVEQVGTPLTTEELNHLEKRTEGWIAGLQLAVLAGKESYQDSRIIASFSGHHHYVVDYLMEEVFSHLPEHMQTFLIQTSILDRLNQPLCSVVTETKENELLRWLSQSNLFLIPLDEERYWFRYHHLFAEFLRNRLKYLPFPVTNLHFRASKWFEENHYLVEAIEHAMFAEDYKRASELIKQVAPTFFKRGEANTLHRWIDQLPSGILRDPTMLVIHTWTQLLQTKFNETLASVDTLEQLMKAVVNEFPTSYLSWLEEEILLIKHYLALFTNDFKTSCQLMQRLLDRDDVHEKLSTFDVFISSGIEFNDGNGSFLRSFFGFFGKIKKAEIYHQIFYAFNMKNQLFQYPFCAHNFAACSEIYYEKNELEEAARMAEQAKNVSLTSGNSGAFLTSVLTLARVYLAQEKVDEAILTIQQATDTFLERKIPHTLWKPVCNAFLAQCYIVKEDTQSLHQWVESSPTVINREVTIFQDFENLTYVRVLLYQKQNENALHFAKRLLEVENKEGRLGSIIENTILQGIALFRIGDTQLAASKLHEALTLGEKEGYLRVFLDERQHLIRLFDEYLALRQTNGIPEFQTGASLAYTQKLLVQMGKQLETANHQPKKDELIAPLTKREMEVLTHMSQGLSNKEIAQQLVLTIGTVKIHLVRIYSKLQVTNRIQAIQKAKEYKLLP